MNFPPVFVKNIHNAFGELGDRWLEDLPSLLVVAARKWDLKIGEPMLLSYNYVTTANRSDGAPVVLKIGVPDKEFTSEMAALKYFDGVGCVRLLDADEPRCMMLLERLVPGDMLVDVQDDDSRTQAACDVMKALWRPAPSGLPLIRLEDWFSKLSGLRIRYSGGVGPFPSNLVERVEALIPELFRESNSPRLIHGDLHHFNILSSGRGWLAIDPKGVIGPPEYECGPFLLNPIPDFPYLPDALRRTQRRIAILSERLGFSRERIRDWGLCHAVLSAWWDLTADDRGVEYTLACAGIIANALG